MISQKCKYAIRAVLFLVVESDEHHKVPMDRIARALNIPKPYLGKILQDLVRKRIVRSVKGPNGGFYLTGKERNIPLIEVIGSVDGLGFFVDCGLGLEGCSDDHPCPIHNDFKEAREHLRTVFSDKSVGDLAAEVESNNVILVR